MAHHYAFLEHYPLSPVSFHSVFCGASRRSAAHKATAPTTEIPSASSTAIAARSVAPVVAMSSTRITPLPAIARTEARRTRMSRALRSLSLGRNPTCPTRPRRGASARTRLPGSRPARSPARRITSTCRYPRSRSRRLRDGRGTNTGALGATRPAVSSSDPSEPCDPRESCEPHEPCDPSEPNGPREPCEARELCRWCSAASAARSGSIIRSPSRRLNP